MTDNEMIPDLCDLSAADSVDWESLYENGKVPIGEDKNALREDVHDAYIDFREREHLGKAVVNAEVRFTVLKLFAIVILSDCRDGKYRRLRFAGLKDIRMEKTLR